MNAINNLSFRKTYTLKAQTPLIHFQHNQGGATLRATEVKPKLDAFLMKKCNGTVPKEWKVSAEHNALNYKLQLKADGKQELVELGMKTDYEIFYGNMGNKDSNEKTLPKKGLVGNVIMTVVCTIPELRQLIDKHIAEFFVVTNFGTMQNKGFGSYTVEGKPCTPWFISQCLKENYGAEACYSFRAGQVPFKAIKTVYSIMKSGVNFRNYQRSLLFMFMHEQHEMGNEKAWLKQKGYAPSNVGTNAYKGDRNQDNHPSYYVRALLGIGDHIDFINDLNNRKDKTTVSITNEGKKIERFHSPILFKVIEGNVYFVARRIEKEIFGAEFKFSSPMGNGKLTVPTEEQLGTDFIDRFLAHCKDELNGVALAKFQDTKYIKIQEV